jgi:UDP-N-acetylglucosamine 4-epimerase
MNPEFSSSPTATSLEALLSHSARWLVTGAAGFIGSHLLETLLRHDQEVVGLDNLSTGHRRNLDDVRAKVSVEQWGRFEFREGDITRPGEVAAAIRGCRYVLHQAALGSVPLSLEQPVTTHASNVTGFVHLLDAARSAGVTRVVYASSSAVYGDCDELPAREDRIGAPLSPYALSKWMDEAYAAIFERCYGLRSIGLRYFNVCGPRQETRTDHRHHRTGRFLPGRIVVVQRLRGSRHHPPGESTFNTGRIDHLYQDPHASGKPALPALR